MKPELREEYILELMEYLKGASTEMESWDNPGESLKLAFTNFNAIDFWLKRAIDDITNGRDALAGQLAVALYEENTEEVAEIAKKAYDRGIEFEDICSPEAQPDNYRRAIAIVEEAEWFKELQKIN